MGNVEKRLTLILIIVTVLAALLVMSITEAQDTSSCDSDPALYAAFGAYCLNPVTWNISEMEYPIGTILLFWDGSATDMGIISGYSWYRNQERYVYWVITRPADWKRNPPFGGEYKIVFPEDAYGVQNG